MELLASYGLPQLPFFGNNAEPPPTPGVRLTLRHDYEVEAPNTVGNWYPLWCNNLPVLPSSNPDPLPTCTRARCALSYPN